MAEHLREDLSLKQIASYAGMSTRTLRRRFLEQTRTSLGKWLAEMRLRRAQHLLEASDLSVETIAREAGFTSTASMRNRFATSVGMSPTSFREAIRRKGGTGDLGSDDRYSQGRIGN